MRQQTDTTGVRRRIRRATTRRKAAGASRGGGLTAVLLAISLVVASPALADPHDDKRRVDRDLARTRATLEAATDRAKDAAAAYAEANRRLPAARDRVAEARGLVAAAEVTLNRARRDAETARSDLSAAKRAYQAAEDRVRDAREEVGEFVSAAYKGSGVVAFNAVLDASSPSDLADRMAFLDDSAAAQRAALNRLIAARHDAKDKQNDAVLAKRRADRAARAAEDALAEAEHARDAAARAKAAVEDLVATRKGALADARAEREATLDRYRELQRESRRIQADIRALADRDRASGAPDEQRPASGYFMMPTEGWKSSDFGRRWDPYYRVWQLHAGMDIAAPGGQAIRAADDGRVFRAGWNGGYGNYTCIYHGLYEGQGLATCYAHQSGIAVSDGEDVDRGEVIGRVGTTGASTGNHLHFEVRLDGTPVNPVRWLPPCLC